MKTTILAILGAVGFSFLCYDREPGLNVLAMAIITIAILVYERKGRNLPWLFLGAHAYTALFTFLNPWDGAILMHLLSLVVLCGSLAASQKTSLYLQGILGATNLPLGMLISLTTGRKSEKSRSPWSVGTLASILGGVAITAFLLFIFTSLYASSNPLFEKLVDSIDLSFLEFGWIWFTLIGFLLYFNLLHPYDPKQLLEVDHRFSNELKAPETPFSQSRIKSLKQETLWGTMAIGSLNALLLFYLILDWIYLGQNDLSTPALQSRAVHAGVEALIVSIVLAMGLLLIFFRGNLNFFSGNRRLYRLSLVWLALNSLLLTHTLIKNSLYIYYSGLTAKRLGVFLFLTLVGVGLVTVLIKILRKKTLMFLIRQNSLSVFVVLIGFLTLPWGPMITAYNLRSLSNPDLEYLMELPKDNALQLMDYAETNPGKVTPEQRRRIAERRELHIKVEEGRNWREWNGYHLLRGHED